MDTEDMVMGTRLAITAAITAVTSSITYIFS